MAASTFTAPGLATLATGAWPALHGIVADRWYDRRARSAVPASGELLGATTLAEQVAGLPDTRVFMTGLDEVGAALPAGRARARLFWMERPGEFAGRGGPAAPWLADFNRLNAAGNLHNAGWDALGARPDAPPLRTLRYDAANPAEFAALYYASPFAQTAQLDFARELVARERLGQNGTFDLLQVTLGSTARLGHETGAHSPLMEQMVLQFDRGVAALLQALDKIPGPENYNLVVAAAHGAPPEPAAESRARMAVPGERVVEAVQRAGVRVQKYLYPFLYLDTADHADPERTRLEAARAALGVPGVAGYCTAGGHCSVGGEFERRFRNSFHALRSGDVMLSYAPEYVEDFGAGRGVSYGSLYNYDVRVPLLLYGPQFRAGVFEEPVEAVDLAPTLARACAAPPPSSATGRVLAETFADAKLKK